MKITHEQVELKDLVRRFFGEKITSEYLRSRMASGVRRDPQLLTQLSELGLDEGFSGESAMFSIVELALIAEEAGRVLLPEPLVERIFGSRLAPRLLSGADAESYRQVIGEVSEVAVAPALSCSLTPSEGGKLSGEVVWGFGIEGASHLLAFADIGSSRSALVLDLARGGVSSAEKSSVDLTASLRSVTILKGEVTYIGQSGAELLEDCFEILKASEVFGMCERVVEMTCEYVKTREQFGVPIGGFQAIQHKLADIYAQTESLGALCRFAAWTVQHSSEDQRRLTARAAALQAATLGPQVCEVALQCHGGIGFTWEYDLHLFLRRAKAIEAGFSLSEERAQELLVRARC